MDTQSSEYGTQDTTPASSTADLVTPPDQSNQPAPSQYSMGAPIPQYPPSYPPLSGAPSPYNTPMPVNPYAGPYAGDATQPGIAGSPMYGQPGYGQSGFGQPAPVSIPFPGYPPAAIPATMTTPPPKAKKRRRGLWIMLTIVLWALDLIVFALSTLNFTVGFCAGCFVYYHLGRLGVLPRVRYSGSFHWRGV